MAQLITELQSGIAWRQSLMPASFNGLQFYVDNGARESARRIVPHEFPKRDVPYAEDMGRKARAFTIRGYLIVYPSDVSFDMRKQKDYTQLRDALIAQLETEGFATLQMPLLGVMKVVCSHYRVSEEEKYGGYCVFDMTFNEYGQPPSTGTRSSSAGVAYKAAGLQTITEAVIADAIKQAGGVSPPVTSGGIEA
jgi:prophage DNA circulation protein